MIKRLGSFLIIALFALVISACNTNSNDDNAEEESNEQTKQTITFGATPWTSTIPPTEIARIMLEDLGYETKVTDADVGPLYTGLNSGELDVYMDSWLPAHKNYLDEYSDSIEHIALSYDNGSYGMAVPKYLEDINDVRDLRGKEEMFDNEFISNEPGDPVTEDFDQLIEENDLDLEQISSSESAMLSVVESRMENEEPVVFYGWRPHSMFNRLDIKELTNEDTPDLMTDSIIHVAVNKELKDSAPDAYNVLSNWSITLEEIEDMIVKIENDEDPREVAREWMENNQDQVDEMMEDY